MKKTFMDNVALYSNAPEEVREYLYNPVNSILAVNYFGDKPYSSLGSLEDQKYYADFEKFIENRNALPVNPKEKVAKNKRFLVTDYNTITDAPLHRNSFDNIYHELPELQQTVDDDDCIIVHQQLSKLCYNLAVAYFGDLCYLSKIESNPEYNYKNWLEWFKDESESSQFWNPKDLLNIVMMKVFDYEYETEKYSSRKKHSMTELHTVKAFNQFISYFSGSSDRAAKLVKVLYPLQQNQFILGNVAISRIYSKENDALNSNDTILGTFVYQAVCEIVDKYFKKLFKEISKEI